jgi:ligand-binding sensor domain-containing protein
MKQSYFLFLSLFCFSNSFAQNVKVDPYYVRSTDTISKYAPNCIVRHILEDRKGNMWFASWSGIVKYDGKEFINYTLKENLIPFHVYSIYEDKVGNLWFGTVRGGAYRFDGKKFRLVSTDTGLPDDLIGSMTMDAAGYMWFATDEGVSRVDTAVINDPDVKNMVALGPGKIKARGYKNYGAPDGLCGNRVNSIIQDKSGKMWIGTRSGVSTYSNEKFTDFIIKPGMPFSNVRSIKQTRDGKIWIGGAEGLYCYDASVKGDSALTKVFPNFIGYIYEDKAGNVWVSAGEANNTMALYRYDRKTFTKIIEKKAPGDMQVFEIVEDKKGNIWFGTMQGPCRYDGTTFTYYKK